MAFGDGIRRNIAAVEPAERTMLRDALIELNTRVYPGSRTDTPAPGGVTWWFKQDEIHAATHIHGEAEFLPWHRELVNRFEELLRQLDPQLSLHYWDWTQDPRAIPNANLGGGISGTLNLFTPDFMGYGGSSPAPIGEPWLSARYYRPGSSPHRDGSGGTAADPPAVVTRFVAGSPAGAQEDRAIVAAGDYATMLGRLESVHGDMHGFVNMGGAHVSFRDPFVFLLHSNVDRLFALWQTQPGIAQRLDPNFVYGPESGNAGLNSNIEPWSTGHAFDQFGIEHFTRPWYAPENEGVPKTCKHPSVVAPPAYDTNGRGAFDWEPWTTVSEGSTLPGAPVSGVALGGDRVALFLADPGGGVYTTSGAGGSWEPWTTVSEGSTLPGAPVSAVALGGDRVALFLADPGGGVYTTSGKR